MDLSNAVILFVTIHEVMAAEKAVKQAGLWYDLVPTPRQLSSDCGMALLAKLDEITAVQELLKQNDISQQGIYQFSQDGFKQIGD